ncbi:MAG: sigma 54-interacting transcriptional regulator, partial [Nitrospinota bacterium]
MTVGDLVTAEDLLATAANNGILPARRGRRGRRSSRQDWFSLEQVVVASPSMKQIFTLAVTLGEADRATVLITGETGTGKEIVARAIHLSSPRANQPLVVVNCGAMPKDL